MKYLFVLGPFLTIAASFIVVTIPDLISKLNLAVIALLIYLLFVLGLCVAFPQARQKPMAKWLSLSLPILVAVITFVAHKFIYGLNV